MRTIVTVVGARPQFVKAAPMSRALVSRRIREVMVHTGQHYDDRMSAVFFRKLRLPAPACNLRVGSGPHGAQTGRMLAGIERVLLDERPPMVLVYGDTNSTLAAALAASKLGIPVAHVEAGLRSFNRRMPEEINRVVTDHLSTLLFAPTDQAVVNLRTEMVPGEVIRTGDIMKDTARLFDQDVDRHAESLLKRHGLTRKGFAFATVHRAENTDDPRRWRAIVKGLSNVARNVMPVVWAVHPRIRHLIAGKTRPRLTLLPPQTYFETQALLKAARVVLTDSGGLQKEAAFHETPCVTLRDETEWVELVEHGVNQLAGARADRIEAMAAQCTWPPSGLPAALYGDGHTATRIAERIGAFLDSTATRVRTRV